MNTAMTNTGCWIGHKLGSCHPSALVKAPAYYFFHPISSHFLFYSLLQFGLIPRKEVPRDAFLDDLLLCCGLLRKRETVE